jgi:arylsulfatase A-like enzyme
MSEGADHTLSSRVRQLTFFLTAILAAATLHAQPPRVVLFLVVDQFIPDYLDSTHTYTGGLKRLRDESAWFTNAHYSQVPTETAPGHATLLTGQPPARTGIVGNDWGNDRLLVPTIGDRLKEKNPLSIVIAISGKERSSRMMAGAKADLTSWYYLKSDAAVERAAEHAMLERNVGEDDVPDLVAISFSATDRVGHRYGPDSSDMAENLLELDKTVGNLLSFCERKFGKDGFVAVLSSDHGVQVMPESDRGRRLGVSRINKDSLKNNIESALEQNFPGQKNVLLKMRLPHLYLDTNKTTSLEKAREAVRNVPGVAEVYAPPFNVADEFNDVYKRSYFPGRSGNLMVRLKKNLLPLERGEGTGHGSPYDYDTHVPILLWGRPFKPGRYAAAADPKNIVPTLAAILELSSETGSEGKPLMEALQK